MEIERKFLVNDIPKDIKIVHTEHIRQGYLAIGDDNSELRIRTNGQKCTLTLKSGKGLVRDELETEISDDLFRALWEKTAGKRIEKNRLNAQYGDIRLEIDIYLDKNAPLSVVEVEFDDIIKCKSFNIPYWFGAEITEDDHYKNQNLAL